MRTAIAIIATVVALSATGYAWHLHSQPRLPYVEPHRTFEHEGSDCVAWRVGRFVVVLCDDDVGVIYPDKPCYSS